MDLDMWRRLRQQFPGRMAGATSGKLVTALIILIMPGGLMLPLCYAAYCSCTYLARLRRSSRTGERAM
jgi:hypothetical protein